MAGHGRQPSDDFEAVEFGDTYVEDDNIRQMLTGQLQCVHSIVCLRNDLIAMTLHQHAYSKANDRMIIHDQHFIHGQSNFRYSNFQSQHNSLVV